MRWDADPADPADPIDPVDSFDPAETEGQPGYDDEVYSSDEEDEIAARLEALGYLD